MSMNTPTLLSLRGLLMMAMLGWLVLHLASCSSARQATVHPARVTTHTMTLSDHEFAPVNFVPQPGDTIVIHNRSDISHSIYITYPDGSLVNMGVQTPGKTVRWQVPPAAKGEFLLQCWIHPIIRATLFVNVTPAVSSVSSAVPAQEIFNGRQNLCSSRNRRT